MAQAGDRGARPCRAEHGGQRAGRGCRDPGRDAAPRGAAAGSAEDEPGRPGGGIPRHGDLTAAEIFGISDAMLRSWTPARNYTWWV